MRLAADIAQEGRIAIVNPQRLAQDSPAETRFDLKSDLYTGLPYTMQHADRLAAQLAQALLPPPPKKGIISDLDDTLWNGIVGEVGTGRGHVGPRQSFAAARPVSEAAGFARRLRDA